VRLRPTLNVKMDLDGGGAPEIKRRRLGNGPTGLGANGNAGGTTTRSGNTGPRTRGMMELNLVSGNEIDEARTQGEDINIAENEVTERRDTSSDSSSEESSDSSDSDDSSGKPPRKLCFVLNS